MMWIPWPSFFDRHRRIMNERTWDNMKINIFQIYYDDATKEQVDPVFIPLENHGNPRPDWREYWPIRNYFLANDLNEDELYGFFSPNFRNKTHLTGQQVHDFIIANPGHDVYTFSPFIQEAACYLNTFEQGSRHHPGLAYLADHFLKSIDIQVNFEDLVMDFSSSVYCNYFVAKPVFWKKWFAITENMFNIAEHKNNDLANELNNSTRYSKGPVDMKVFIMERVCSLILALDSGLSVASYDIAKMPWSHPLFYPYREELFTLNALKLAFAHTSDKIYLRQFQELRRRVFIKCDPFYVDRHESHFF
jgi:hypothetical protein